MTDRLHCPLFHATDGRCCPDSDPDCLCAPLPTVQTLQNDAYRLMLASLVGVALIGAGMFAALRIEHHQARLDLQQQELRGTLAIRAGEARHDQ